MDIKTRIDALSEEEAKAALYLAIKALRGTKGGEKMNVVNLSDYRENKEPHILAELMCVGCLHRWVGVYPSDVWLSDLECPHCFQTGNIIKTGAGY